MGNEHGSQFQQGTFNWGAEVKPQGPGGRAELPVARPLTEHGKRASSAVKTEELHQVEN